MITAWLLVSHFGGGIENPHAAPPSLLASSVRWLLRMRCLISGLKRALSMIFKACLAVLAGVELMLYLMAHPLFFAFAFQTIDHRVAGHLPHLSTLDAAIFRLESIFGTDCCQHSAVKAK